ncbi:vitamin K-dependent gamma-carboxylase-like [Argopecten irradians]|uniref:vitamin K-dependent gamma-carboxylase-like n=1 Tax=Argopecten irradians TaxID=31199 RepID=UPI0037170221
MQVIRQRKETGTNNVQGSKKMAGLERKYSSSTEQHGRQEKLFGFSFTELASWNSFVKLMSRPTDPAALGVLRFLYGILLMIDTLEKKGLGTMSFRKWEKCTFPVLYFLKPLPLDWMYLIHFILFITTIGIALGFMYRWCLVIFNVIYWYIHLLDMQKWNNHSYLFGLLSFLLLTADGNRYLSIDSIVWPKLRNQAVPLWNYTLFRFQVFLLYFFAGIKKLDAEWLYGYSEKGLSKHWVFDVFRPFLSNEMIDLYIVHRFGFLLDLTLGFILFFDKSRKTGILMALSFHAMNSQIFFIGMFPYIGIATVSIFCYPDWPRKVMSRILFWKSRPPVYLKYNHHCLYGDDGKAYKENGDQMIHVNGRKQKDTSKSLRPGAYHVLCTVFVILYIAEQIFLPFSLGILFKGLKTWGGELYGFTWNMMIEKHIADVSIFVKDLETGERVDMSQSMLKFGVGNRWAYTPVMLTQFTQCIPKRLQAQGHSNFAINYDVWLALNHRFRQRVVDPNKDIMTARWNLFEDTDWWMPVTEGFWEMRKVKNRMQKEKDETTTKSYIADFPGNHTSFSINDINAINSMELLKGTVILETIGQANVTFEAGGKAELLSGKDY